MKDIEKLPKWAQKEIAVIELRLLEANAELKRLTENTPSKDFVPHYRGNRDGVFYLDDKKTFRFVVGNEHYEYIDISLDRGMIILRAGDALAIPPSSSTAAAATVRRL